MGLICCTETSATNYQSTLSNITEERRSHVVPLIHNLGTGCSLVASFQSCRFTPWETASSAHSREGWLSLAARLDLFFLGGGGVGQCRPTYLASVSNITTTPLLPVPSYLLKMSLWSILILYSLHKVCYLRSLLFSFSS